MSFNKLLLGVANMGLHRVVPSLIAKSYHQYSPQKINTSSDSSPQYFPYQSITLFLKGVRSLSYQWIHHSKFTYKFYITYNGRRIYTFLDDDSVSVVNSFVKSTPTISGPDYTLSSESATINLLNTLGVSAEIMDKEGVSLSLIISPDTTAITCTTDQCMAVTIPQMYLTKIKAYNSKGKEVSLTDEATLPSISNLNQHYLFNHYNLGIGVSRADINSASITPFLIAWLNSDSGYKGNDWYGGNTYSRMPNGSEVEVMISTLGLDSIQGKNGQYNKNIFTTPVLDLSGSLGGVVNPFTTPLNEVGNSSQLYAIHKYDQVAVESVGYQVQGLSTELTDNGLIYPANSQANNAIFYFQSGEEGIIDPLTRQPIYPIQVV